MKKILSYTFLFLITNNLFAQIPENGLVGYWPFNGNADDESGNDNHGSVNGATLTIDKFGNPNQSYSFDGENDYILLPNNILTTSNAFSISLWIKFQGENSTEAYNAQTIFSLRGQFQIFISLVESDDISNPNSIRFFCGSDSSLYSENNSVITNTWQHIVAVYSNGIMKLYIDGVLKGTMSSSPPSPLTNHLSIIGKDYTGTTINRLWFNGDMDNIRVYNRGLSEQEIIILLNESAPLIQSQNAWQTNSNDIFYYNGEGNVGIGTNTPAAKLTVAGPVLATEIKVKTDISEYPDFVFKPEYKIRTIEETEQYIKENGHLPEIPKASEVEEGVNLGEMNVKLLQKIEELTLYIIEQNRRIQVLEEKLEDKK